MRVNLLSTDNSCLDGRSYLSALSVDLRPKTSFIVERINSVRLSVLAGQRSGDREPAYDSDETFRLFTAHFEY